MRHFAASGLVSRSPLVDISVSSDNLSRRRLAAVAMVLGGLTFGLNIAFVSRALGQTVTATVETGTQPQAVAVNPVTNKIYVAVLDSYNVTVIDGATNGITTITVPNAPVALAANPVTNKIYVANNNSNTVTVIDGATNATTTVTDPNAVEPTAVAVNPVTNKVYVANWGSGNVTVIDGTTDSVITVTDPHAFRPNIVVTCSPFSEQVRV